MAAYCMLARSVIPEAWLKRFGVLFLLLVSAGLVTLSAQTKRTFTNPRPEPYFKTLFPNAGGFSTFGGTPLHYKVYGVDPKTNPSGAADRLHLLDHRRRRRRTWAITARFTSWSAWTRAA